MDGCNQGEWRLSRENLRAGNSCAGNRFAAARSLGDSNRLRKTAVPDTGRYLRAAAPGDEALRLAWENLPDATDAPARTTALV